MTVTPSDIMSAPVQQPADISSTPPPAAIWYSKQPPQGVFCCCCCRFYYFIFYVIIILFLLLAHPPHPGCPSGLGGGIFFLFIAVLLFLLLLLLHPRLRAWIHGRGWHRGHGEGGGESRERARPPRHRSPRSIPAGSYSNSAIPPGHAHTHAHTLTHTHAHPPLTPTRGRRGGRGGTAGTAAAPSAISLPPVPMATGCGCTWAASQPPPAGLRRVLWGAVGCQQDPSCHPPDPKVTAGPLLPVSCRASCQQPSG